MTSSSAKDLKVINYLLTHPILVNDGISKNQFQTSLERDFCIGKQDNKPSMEKYKALAVVCAPKDKVLTTPLDGNEHRRERDIFHGHLYFPGSNDKEGKKCLYENDH